MRLSEAFAEAWRQQRATAPRRALVKEAFDVTRRLPGIRDASADEIRAALRLGLAARGIDDLPDRSLDPMTRAIQTSRASVLADYARTGLQKTREAMAWLREHQIPAWLNPPDHAVPLQRSAGVEPALGRVRLEPRDLPLLARLLAEAHVLPGEVDDLEPSFPCWLDLENRRDPESAVVVHVGTYRLGRLEEEAAVRVRPELTRLVGKRKSLLARAELHGSTADTVRVEVRLTTLVR